MHRSCQGTVELLLFGASLTTFFLSGRMSLSQSKRNPGESCMKGKWLSVVALAVLGGLLFSVSSCGRDQQLVSIQIQPNTETFGSSDTPPQSDAGLQVQLRALGTYIHPPVTKDITSQVTWFSNDTQMMTVDASGMLTAVGQSCGSTLVSATVKTNTSSGGVSSNGAIVTGYMTGNLVCFTGSGTGGGGGGGSGPSITLTFLGTGSGQVTSNPTGLSCASSVGTCSAPFPSGSTVTLTAAPTGTFGGWGGGCDSVTGSGLICTINNLTAARAVTATFN